MRDGRLAGVDPRRVAPRPLSAQLRSSVSSVPGAKSGGGEYATPATHPIYVGRRVATKKIRGMGKSVTPCRGG
jgi:hypothetical protein